MGSIICWWSGGITSAVACKLSIDKYGLDNCRAIILDTGNEHSDTYRFLKDCEKWYGLKIEKFKNEDYEDIKMVWRRHVSLNTAKGAVCSYKLKRVVRERWQKVNEYKHQVFGFEFDPKEINRAKALELNHPKTKPIFPLIENELNKKQCLDIVTGAGIRIPAAYLMGFKNNNCLDDSPNGSGGCTQGGVGYWKKLQTELPQVFNNRADLEHELTNIKGSPVTMLKDQSKKAKESGVQLVFLKKHPDYPDHKCIDDMKGRPVEPLLDCNSFCGVDDLNKNSPTESEINWESEE